MKTFLLKHKSTIIFWIVFSFIAVFFAHRQKDFYLDADIKNFKENYFNAFLLGAGVILCVLVFVLSLSYTKSIKKSFFPFLNVSMMIVIYLFLFQNIFLGFALFLNRQYKKEQIERKYVVGYLVVDTPIKKYFHPYEISDNPGFADRKLRNKLYQPELKQNDTIGLVLHKGLFGVPFQTEPFDDKNDP